MASSSDEAESNENMHVEHDLRRGLFFPTYIKLDISRFSTSWHRRDSRRAGASLLLLSRWVCLLTRSLVRCPDQLACVLDCCGMPVSSAAGVTPELYVASLQDRVMSGLVPRSTGMEASTYAERTILPFPNLGIQFFFHFVPPYIYRLQGHLSCWPS